MKELKILKVLSVISALVVVAFVIYGCVTAVADGEFKVLFVLCVLSFAAVLWTIIADSVERDPRTEPAPTLASRSIFTVELGDSFLLEHKSDNAEGAGVVFESWNTNVVTVDDWGKVKAVGRGMTVLTITVGDEPFAVVVAVRAKVSKAS